MATQTPNPRKARGIRLLGPVDVAALRAAVLAVPDSEWERENTATRTTGA